MTMSNRLKIVLVSGLTLLGLMFVAGVAMAATGGVVGDGDPLGDILRAVFEAFRGGDYPEAGALALVAAVACARRYGVKYWPLLGTAEGALGLVIVGAFATSFASQLAGPATFTMAAFWVALKVAGGAAGGFAMISKLIMPLLRWLQGKLPGPVAKVLGYVLGIAGSIFENTAIKKAEAAGKAAVEAKKAGGAASVIGDPTDFS